MHHALLLEGTYEWALTVLPPLYRNESPDVVHYRGIRMTIEDARTLIEKAHRTPLVGKECVFILAYTDFIREAQNALLKLLEEPPSTARFFIVTTRSEVILPTLASRLLRFEKEAEKEDQQEFTSFFELSYAERLKEIGNHAQKKDDAWLTSLMDACETQVERGRDISSMRMLLELRAYASLPGASKKMILEHFVLMAHK